MNNPLTIIVPMAGRGSRFTCDGWTVPKPFIDVKGKMMVELVLEGITQENAKIVLVVRDDFTPKYKKQIDYLEERFHASSVSVSAVTMGAACTVLAARDVMGEGALVVADSDTLYRPPVFSRFVADAQQRQLDVSLLSMKSDNPSFSYARLGADGFVEEIAEKQVISSYALCGAYYFASKEYFVSSLIELMIYGKTVNGEFYLSQVCQNLILCKKVLSIFEAQSDDIICFGTPQQMYDVLHRI